MEIAITKDFFEKVLPVAASAHEEVFEKVEAQFPVSADTAMELFFDRQGDTYMKDGAVAETFKTYVCVHAFLTLLPQLDLILTPTGFGVVGNDELTPASKARVDALKANLEWRLMDTHSSMIQILVHTEGWGESLSARNLVTSIVYCQRVLCRLLQKETNTTELYNGNLSAIADVDFLIKHTVSVAQFEEFLGKIRTGNLSGKHLDAVAFMLDIYRFHILGQEKLKHMAVQALIDFLDQNPDVFVIYHSSREYKAIHNDSFKNTADAPAYFFG